MLGCLPLVAPAMGAFEKSGFLHLTVALVPVLTALLGLLAHVGLGGSSVHLSGPVETGG